MRRPLLWSWVFFALLAFGPAAAQDARARLSAGGLSATAPPGWHAEVSDDNMVFAPGTGTQDVTLLVSAGGVKASTVDALVEQTWKSFAASMKVTGKKRGPASKTRAGFQLQLSFGSVTANGEAATLVVGAMLRTDAQAVVVIFLTRPELFEQHAEAIGALIDSIDTAGGRRPPPDRAAQAGFPDPQPVAGMGKGATGAWAVLRTGARASASSMTGVDLSARWDVFVLLPDGHYTSRIDPQGLNAKTTEQLESRWPQYWGTYKASGNEVALTTSNGITSTYRLNGNVMVPTGRTSGSDLVRADTGSDLRIDGTFARYNVTTKTFGNTLPVIVFRADGTFEDRYQGVYTVLKHEREWKGTSARGHYRIHHNSLYFQYDDGRKQLTHIAILPTGGSRGEPRGLYVGDWWLTRR